MNSRKREKPHPSHYAPYSAPKRRRHLPLDAGGGEDAIEDSSISAATEKSQKSVVVIGLPTECSVLDLKSRFEMYGPISRTRMETNGVAYINFRSNEAAKAAVDAGRDLEFPITLHSIKVQVMWASDPVPQWREGVRQKDGLSSKLVRAELPLRRYGRGNRLGSAIVNPRLQNNVIDGKSDDGVDKGDMVKKADPIVNPGSVGPFRGREIVAYDDIL